MKLSAVVLLALPLIAGCASVPAAPAGTIVAKTGKAADPNGPAAPAMPKVQPPQPRNEEAAAGLAEMVPSNYAAPKAIVGEVDGGNGCTWIESENQINVGEEDTKARVHELAIKAAESHGIEDFLGVTIRQKGVVQQSSQQDDSTTFIDSKLETERNGRILSERVLQEGYRSSPGGASDRYFARIKMCVAKVDHIDKDFYAQLEIQPRDNFVEGDQAKIVVTPSQDCYAYLYDIDADKNTSLIVPNEAVSEVKLRAGQKWEYPDESARKMGVKLVAQLPAGKAKSFETVRVIVSKVKLPEGMQDPVGGYLSLLRRLSNSRIEWTDDAHAFTIVRH